METQAYMDPANVCIVNYKAKSLISDDAEICKVPELTFDATVNIDALDFFNFIECASRMDFESMKIILNSELEDVDFDCESKESSLHYHTKNIHLENERDIISKYSIEYLFSFLKDLGRTKLKGEKVQLKFSKDYPLLISVNDKWMILAPRVVN